MDVDIGGYEDHNEWLITNVIVGEKKNVLGQTTGGGVWMICKERVEEEKERKKKIRKTREGNEGPFILFWALVGAGGV